MAATIHDVAKMAGVNASTVSRVLNQKATISEETKQRVFAAMRQLDYHPNSMARSLASGLAGAIGLVLDAEDEKAFHNAFFSSSQFAIEKVAQAHHCHVIIVNGGGTHAEHAVRGLIMESRVDGLILPPSAINMTLLCRLEGFPYVLLGKPSGLQREASWVDNDNERGAAMAVRHLLGKGYRDIAYLGGKHQGADTMDFVQRRVMGYYRALPQGAKAWALPSDGTPETAYRAAVDCLREAHHPDAFVCDDNLSAFGLLRAARELGLSVPEDIGIVTFNNYPLAEYTDPPLTAVHIDTSLLGEETARLLFRHIERKGKEDTAQQLLLPPSLIERISSDGPRMGMA